MCPALLFIHLLFFTQNVWGHCGYVDWTATVGSLFTVGEFILSEKKCQSLSAELNVFGSIQKIDGAIEFACDPTDNTTLIIHEYRDVLCSTQSSPAMTLQVGDSIPLFNDALFFHLDEFVCSTTPDCGIDVTFSTDCRGIDSKGYSHLAIPPNSCQTFGDAFNNPLLRRVPYEIFPTGVVDGLYSTALQFKCCEEDHSLLIYNYSGSNCLQSAPHNTLRLSNQYNGQCFALGNTQKPFDSASDKAATEDVNAAQDVYALRYRWSCDELVDCAGISFMEERQIPNLCPDQCLVPGTVWTTPAPTSSPTIHPISDSESDPVTASPRNIHQHGSSSGDTKHYVVYGVLIVFGVFALIAIGYIMYHRCKLQRVVEHTEPSAIQVRDSRCEPMIDMNQTVEPTLINVTSVKDEDETTKEATGGEYVLPSTVTAGGKGESNKDANLLP